jgi:hypothetical protein
MRHAQRQRKGNYMKPYLCLINASGLLAGFLFVAGPAWAEEGQGEIPKFNLTGIWLDEKGQRYKLRQAGEQIFWGLELKSLGTINIFHGNIHKNLLFGEWVDMPGGRLLSNGKMNIKIESNNHLVQIWSNPTYYGSSWNREESPQILEILSKVYPPSDPKAKILSKPLKEGRWYRIKAEGVVGLWGEDRDGVDAIFCYHKGMHGYCNNSPEDWKELKIDGKSLREIDETIKFSEEHIYEIRKLGEGKALEFTFLDVLNGYGGDNTGSIMVTITAEPATSPKATEAEEGEDCGKGNVALKKPAQMSSQDYGGTPEAGVDELKDGGYGVHTRFEKEPWWQVDLGKVCSLSKIVVYNRTNCCSERANTLKILATKEEKITPQTQWKEIASFKKLHPYGGDESNPVPFRGVDGGGKKTTPGPWTFTLEKSVAARWVRLQLGAEEFLNLDEIEIYGTTSKASP